ncbi:DUF5825 family protein [Streptomyces sp. NBC_00237]|uniref:DUF5825 family protein n=1 Tax=Streptomyces sp. NBC_00237 TaxID=2975687 RepID=UPI0022501E21|nr:DUF5825 family protein [Streptomyces sp. NBC_00237]MCX5205480.1 DUF5825 family protein [Streptomyces sp. NBC_00237]
MDTALAPAEAASPLAVTAWRDYDEVACALPGMLLGDLELTGPIAEEADRLWESGARRVRLAEPVDLTATDGLAAARRTVRALSLVRDLTARAVLVEWDLRLDPARPEDPLVLSHLQPPRTLHGHPDAQAALATWRGGHYLGKCLWRNGPGFFQIRDRRWGNLQRFTADEPHYRTAVDALAYGAPQQDVPRDALDDFTGERLVLHLGPLAWWVPYRVSRWTQEAMAI